MMILAIACITIAGIGSRRFRQTAGLAFWVCLAMTLITLYGMTLP
jgi:hypothetical protein